VLWLPINASIIAFIAWAIATARVPGWSWPLLSIVIGCCLAGITFLGHETLHGGVVRGRAAIRIIGWFGFLPFTVSPQLWMAWHNRVHHNHCNQEGRDPDMYPTLHEYKTQRTARILADFGMGRRHPVGLLSLLVGFTGQSTQVLLTARSKNYINARLFRRVLLESALGWAFWATVAVIVGFVPFIFVYLLPLVVANTIVMCFIMSNHNLSPLTPVNDPLVNSLSVTLPRVVEWLTLDFGFHTEHHLFPTASTRHGRKIRDVIRSRYPERYQSLSLFTALTQLYNTFRVYKDDVTLMDPATGETWPVLMPGTPATPSTEVAAPEGVAGTAAAAAAAAAPAAAAATAGAAAAAGAAPVSVPPSTPHPSKLEEAKAAAARKLDEAAHKLEEVKAAAARKIDDAKAAAAKKLDEAARKLDDAKVAASKAIDEAKTAASKAIDEVLEPTPDPTRV
jgi:fatty acid desaturase